MLKKASAYYRPESLAQALRLLAQPDTVPLGGGTKLLAGEVTGRPGVVDLQALGLNQIQWIETDQPKQRYLQVGATTRLAELAAFLSAEDTSGSPAALLQKAVHQAGPNTYRNAATLGGSVAARLPDSELLAALLVLEAELILYGPDEVRVDLVDYLTAGERPSGLITSIHIPWGEGQGTSHRVARTPADTPIVSITLWQPAAGRPRLAATGIAPRPCRLQEAESALENGMTAEAIEKAAEAARSAVVHPGDFRGDAAYRAEMAAVLSKRALQA